jgi:hypothetical protein
METKQKKTGERKKKKVDIDKKLDDSISRESYIDPAVCIIS